VEKRGVQRLAKYWGKWFAPMGDGDVKETNLNIFYQLGRSLAVFDEKLLTNIKISEISIQIFDANEWLRQFVNETEVYAAFPKDTRASAKSLQNKTFSLLNACTNNHERRVLQSEVSEIVIELREFEASFDREHRSLMVFTVTPKGIYDTSMLLTSPENKFPDKIRPFLAAEMLYDLQQAARCLAFDIPTACAFHICRGTEAVMLKYYELLKRQRWNFVKKDWKIYVEQLHNESAPENITNRLDEIRRIDRNPYIHPEQNVTLEEAPVLFELCTGVLFMMGQEMVKLST
jgi:hypothetical protein